MKWKEIMRYMTKKCQQLLEDWKVGDTCWKECNSSLRSGLIMKTWSIL